MFRLREILKTKVFFLLLLPVFYTVHASQRYAGFISVGDVAIMTGLYLALAVFVFLLTRMVVHSNIKAAVLAFLLLIPFFFWGYVHDHLRNAVPGSFLAHTTWLLPVWLLLLFVLFLIFLRSKPPAQRNIVLFLNSLFFIYILVDLSLIVSKAIGKPEPAKRADKGTLANVQLQHRWNVYFIIFDEYASTQSLKANLGYDNSAMDSFFVRNSFSVQPESHSNYNLTAFSLASILNMSYLPLDHAEATLKDYSDCASLIKNNEVMRLYRSAGYEVKNYSIFDMENSPSIINETFLPVKTRLITAPTFYERILKYQLMKLGWGVNDRFMSSSNFYRYHDYNNSIFESLRKELKQPTDRPKFVYAHFMMPHIPYYFDANGQMEQVSVALQKSSTLDPQYYLYNLAYTNRKIRELIAAIPEAEKKKSVIIIMGDHGFKRKVHASDDGFLFENMSAIHIPQIQNSIPQDLDGVNTFRFIINNMFDAKLPMEKDSTIVLTEKEDD